MWSLYADNSKGVCIEYTVPETFELLVLSVIYSHVRGNMNRLMMLNDFLTNDAFIYVLAESVLRKDICWLEQNEYRLICPRGTFDRDLCKFFPLRGFTWGIE